MLARVTKANAHRESMSLPRKTLHSDEQQVWSDARTSRLPWRGPHGAHQTCRGPSAVSGSPCRLLVLTVRDGNICSLGLPHQSLLRKVSPWCWFFLGCTCLVETSLENDETTLDRFSRGDNRRDVFYTEIN